MMCKASMPRVKAIFSRYKIYNKIKKSLCLGLTVFSRKNPRSFGISNRKSEEHILSLDMQISLAGEFVLRWTTEYHIKLFSLNVFSR